MKLQGQWIASLLVVSIASVLICGAVAAPTETRASHLGVVAAGMGKIMHMEDYLQDYPGSRTAILSYQKLDGSDVGSTIGYLRANAAVQARMGRDFWPQIPLETDGLSLEAFYTELSRPGSKVDVNVRALAHEIARYREKNKWFFIRPFSEMNDATQSAPWEFGSRQYANTPLQMAAAWKLLRETFDQEGALNAIFVFSPLAAYGVHRESQVQAALNLIPPGDIDALGLNLYSRPMTAYGGNSSDPIPFATLAQPWIALLAHSKHRGIPLIVSEMGVSNQASDEKRAQWIHEAFRFARSNGFVMVTYFNYPHRYWQVDEQTRAGEALYEEIER